MCVPSPVLPWNHLDADCNADPKTGVYSCVCSDVKNCSALTTSAPYVCDLSAGCRFNRADDRCEPYGCGNITERWFCESGYGKCA